MSTENLIIFLVIGLCAGWLAGQNMKGGGFGLLGLLITALVGAIVLLAPIRLVKRA